MRACCADTWRTDPKIYSNSAFYAPRPTSGSAAPMPPRLLPNSPPPPHPSRRPCRLAPLHRPASPLTSPPRRHLLRFVLIATGLEMVAQEQTAAGSAGSASESSESPVVLPALAVAAAAAFLVTRGPPRSTTTPRTCSTSLPVAFRDDDRYSLQRWSDNRSTATNHPRRSGNTMHPHRSVARPRAGGSTPRWRLVAPTLHSLLHA